MNISDKIPKIKEIYESNNDIKPMTPSKLECNFFSVYDYEGMSITELLCEFFTKINELIGSVNETVDLVEWLVNEGLEIEVSIRLNEWLIDGTLAEIINETVFKELNLKIDNINIDLNNKIIDRTFKFVEDFGAVGDGYTDDTTSLNKACEWSRTNNKPVYFKNKRYYISNSIHIGNAILRSESDVPGSADVLYLQRRNGTFVTGSHDWSYLYNTNLNLTWRYVMDEVSWGCCIISDKDIGMLRCKQNEVINIRGIGIIGDHRTSNQNGIIDDTPTKYNGNKHYINNINVIGCGGTGIILRRGYEVSSMENVVCDCNMGYGLYTGQTDNIDSATEYLTFSNCKFSNNRLDGVHFSYWRKDINFVGCYFNGNGQYYINEVDPLKGYNRKLPVNLKDVYASVKFAKGNIESNNTNMGLTFKNCYGEDVAKGVHIENDVGVGVVNNVNFENNIFYQGNVPNSDNYRLTCIYINVNYISNWTVQGNYGNNMDVITLEKTPTNGGNNNLLDITTYPIRYRQEINSFENIETNKRVYSNNVLFRDLIGNGGIVDVDSIQKDFTLSVASGESNMTATYMLTSHWQGTNADTFGGYMLVVTKMPSGKYKMIYLQMSDSEGFTAHPFLEEDGMLDIHTMEFFKYTLTRIDVNKTN